MASIFERIRNSFKAATSSTTASADRNVNRGRDTPSTRTGRVAQNLLTDLAISFGNTEGISSEGLRDYENRTQASKDAMQALQDRNQRDSGSSTPPPAAAAPTVETVAEPVAETPEPPATPVEPVKLEPVGGSTTTAGSAEEEADILEAGATGDAEKKVADTIRKKGRRSTIQTTSKGLLTDAPTRRRRSLMGGGLIA